ncbi:MAG: hypothetical protein U0457_09475 [Candidatus Sericytochromatia bacterium]
MKDLFLKLITLSYGITGIIGLIAYLPTLKDLYLHKKQSANISSYILWTATGGISFLYGIFILKDFLFIAVSGLNFLACLVVLILSIKLK